ARSDLFSLGCVLYRMGTGKAPFEGRNVTATLLALTQDQPQPPRALNPNLPAPLSELIMTLLAKNRNDRPASARKVADTLSGMEKDQTTQVGQPGAAILRTGGLFPQT